MSIPFLTALFGTSLLLAGCGGAKVVAVATPDVKFPVVANPDVKFPIAATSAAPLFLFPMNFSHLYATGVDPKALGLTVDAAIIAEFGKSAISDQKLLDGVGDLSFELPEDIRAEAEKNSFTMEGAAVGVSFLLRDQMILISARLRKLKVLDTPFTFKYIVALHSHGSKGTTPNTLNVDSWGGVYDVETKEIVSYIENRDTYPDKPETITASLPPVYTKIIHELIDGVTK